MIILLALPYPFCQWFVIVIVYHFGVSLYDVIRIIMFRGSLAIRHVSSGQGGIVLPSRQASSLVIATMVSIRDSVVLTMVLKCARVSPSAVPRRGLEAHCLLSDTMQILPACQPRQCQQHVVDRIWPKRCYHWLFC